MLGIGWKELAIVIVVAIVIIGIVKLRGRMS
jgi:Sec-independent protein translocase protein TatA